MEFSNELFGALYIADGAPFIFFNTITLPMYEVLNLSMEYPAVKDFLNFIFFDAVANDQGWWRWVAFLTFRD